MAAITRFLPDAQVTSTEQLSFRQAETLARKLSAGKSQEAPDARP
jgi:hypothetical protein